MNDDNAKLKKKIRKKLRKDLRSAFKEREYCIRAHYDAGYDTCNRRIDYICYQMDKHGMPVPCSSRVTLSFIVTFLIVSISYLLFRFMS